MPHATLPTSIPNIVSCHDHGDPDKSPDLLIEVPHGATLAEHFDQLRDELCGTYPDDLQDFFFVNTDVGSFELAQRVAAGWATSGTNRRAWVIRSLVPRTFIDCNRVIDRDAAPTTAGSGAPEITPGLHAYVTDPRDREWLIDRHRRYIEVAEAAYAGVCGGDAKGRALMLHTYAPRSLQIETDENVVQALHREYQPDRIEHWPLRTEVDLIADDPEGRRHANSEMVEGLQASCAAADYEVGVCRTYTLHAGTFARVFAERYPEQTLCVEFRRDLLVPQFTPFAEMRGDDEKVERAARAILAGIEAGG